MFSCSHDNLLKSWSLSSGRLEQTFIGSERAIYTIHLSPFNPSLLFSGGYDCAIRVWDIKSGQCTVTLKGHTDSIFSLLLLPDGRLVSGSSDKTIKVWNLKGKAGKQCEATLTGHLGGVLSLLWVQGMGCFVSASIDHTVKLWSLRELRCEMTMIGHTLPVSALVLIDEQRIVSASHDKTIRVWNIAATAAPAAAPHHRKARCELVVTAHTAPIQALTLLSPSHLVSCSRDLSIKVWSLSSLSSPPLLTLQGHTKDINSLSVTADGRLVSASSDCSIRVWSIDLSAGTGHCDQSFTNVGAEGRSFVVYGVCSFRQQPAPEEAAAGSIRRSASKNNMQQLQQQAMAAAVSPSSTAALPPTSSASTNAALIASPSLPPTVPAAGDAPASLLRSRGRTRPVGSVSTAAKAEVPAAAQSEARRLEKMKRARELEHLRQVAEARMLEESELGDEEEARRFSSLLSLKRDSEISEGAQATVSKYRNAHHLNYSDILSDGWYDDGGIIPGVNVAKVGRERGGGRWEGDVIVFDSAADSALADIVDTAKKLVRQQETVKGRVQMLAQLVSNRLGGLPNDVVQAWERLVKKAVRYRQQRLAAMTTAEQQAVDPRMLLPVGALLGEAGLTRHRACLFKYLCDLTVQNPEEWCWPVDEALSPGAEEERDGAEGGKREKGEGGADDAVAMRLSRFLDDSALGERAGGAGAAGFDDEKAEDAIVEERYSHRLGGLRRSSDSDVEDKASELPAAVRQHSATPDELAIHCRLIRGQYQYYVPRSRKHWKDNNAALSPTAASGSAAVSPSGASSAGSSGSDDDERGRERVGGYHAWNVVIIGGQHYVVDLIYQPSMLYHESSREAMHYNRGRRGAPKQTGLTNLPVRDVREIEWAELSSISSMKDGGFGRVEKAKWRGLDVVIKTPLTADLYVIKTFIEEARVLNTLSHPNIVQLIGVCSAKKAIIIEYINGGDVHQWLKARRHSGPAAVAITLKQRLDVLIQSALAMQYLHGCEPPIVHRDLKTLNLLIQNIAEKRVIKVCFPQRDHQLLTRDGFRDFDHFRSALARGEAVSVACPVRRRPSDPLDQLALEYHDVMGLDALVDESCVELVQMRSQTAASICGAKGGREETMQSLADNGMDLQLTPEHQLPVGLAAYAAVPSQDTAPMQRRTAREVLDSGAECAGFVCHAVHGVSDPTPHLPLPFAVALGLITEDEVDAFVELYGYWLAVGSLLADDVDAVTFAAYEGADAACIDDLLRRLPLSELPPGPLLDRHGYRKCDPADGDDGDFDDDGDAEDDEVILVQDEQADDSFPLPAVARPRLHRKRCSHLIYDPRWFRYFAEQYGHQYWGPDMAEAAVAGARRRGSGLPLPRHAGFYDPRVNSGQRLHDACEKHVKGTAVVDPFASPTRSRASSSSSSSSSSPSPASAPASPYVSRHDEDGDQPQLSASSTVEAAPSESWSVPSTMSSAPPRLTSPQPLDAEDVPLAKWAWCWVWQRLCARRVRLLLRGLRLADRDQGRELDCQRRLEAEAVTAREEQRWEDAAAIDEQLRSSRQTGVPLTSGRIHTASARCCEEYLHMALRAGFTGTTLLRRRAGQTSARPLWQVEYTGESVDGVRPRLVINPSAHRAAKLGIPQLAHKEISLLRLATPEKVWCVQVPTADHLIVVRRVRRDGSGRVVSSSRPAVVGNCDFGLARNQKSNDGISTQHKDMGTPCFQSPEQWRDDEEERLTEKTDCYSFGGIVLEVLTDRIPWHEEKSKYAIYQHVVVEKKGPPISAAAVGGGFVVPQMLIDLIRWCQTFEPDKRPSFPEILRVLREVDDSLPPDG